jgi:aspartate aminotransferase
VGAIAGIMLIDRLGKGIRTSPRDAMISLSTPKQELATAFGVHHLALSQMMLIADRREFRAVVFAAQRAMGWCFPSALMQHSLPDLELLSIDQCALARRARQSGSGATELWI